MTNTTQTIANQINNFDFYFTMSDDDRKYDEGNRALDQIEKALSSMTESELIEVKAAITVIDETLFRYFREQFENLPTLEAASGERAQDDEIQPTESNSESFRSVIFRNAWAMFNRGLFSSIGAALKAAWRRFKLVRSLRKGLAYFSFTKANGDQREAIGTLAGNNFDYQYKGQRSTGKPELVKYWDVQARAFRSCRLDRLVSIS